MKKVLILSAFGMLAFGAANATNAVTPSVYVITEDGRTPVKLDSLPEAVKRTLTGDAFKGWTATEAFLVKKGEAEYYEITLIKEQETKILKINKEGVIVE